MDRIRECADTSIRRGLAFAGFAIICVMIGLSFDPALALRSAAILAALVTAVLVYKGWLAPQQPYRHTEVWILLDKCHGLPEREAQRAIGQMLRTSYLLHAEATAAVTVGLWLLNFVASLLLPSPAAGLQ